jgi:hypothetical protein
MKKGVGWLRINVAKTKIMVSKTGVGNRNLEKR